MIDFALILLSEFMKDNYMKCSRRERERESEGGAEKRDRKRFIIFGCFSDYYVILVIYVKY